MDKKDDLLQFAKSAKWDDLVADEGILDLLVKIKERAAEVAKANDSEDPDIASAARVKLVVVGDGAVGKTSMLIVYSTGDFPTEYLPTVFENYTAQTKRKSTGQNVLLHLWDTAGQEDYDRLRPLSYPGADIVLLCFSTVNRASFEAVKEKWAPEIHHYIPSVPSFLVGTKVDLRREEHPDPNSGKFDPITVEEAEKMAKEVGAEKYVEISSKTQEGIPELFNGAVELVIGERDGAGGGHDDSSGRKKKKGGCIML